MPQVSPQTMRSQAISIVPMTPAEAMGLLIDLIARPISGAQGHWTGWTPIAEQRICFDNQWSHLDRELIWAAMSLDLRAQTRTISASDCWTWSPFKCWIARAVFNAAPFRRRGTDDRDPQLEALKKGGSLVWIAPTGALRAASLGALAGGCGKLGCLATRAPRKDVGYFCRSNRSSVNSAVGLLAPAPPLCIATPIFFHSVRWRLLTP